jgi:hypothetical protein
MTEKTKKILLILLFVLVTIGIALTLYYLFFRQIITPTPSVVVTPPLINGLPQVAPGVNAPIYPLLNIQPGLPTGIPAVPPTPIIPGPVISFQANGGITSFQTMESDSTKNPTIASNGQNVNYYDTNTGFFYTMTPEGQKQFFSDTAFPNVSDVVWSPDSRKAILEYPDGSKIIYDFAQKKSVTLPSQWKDFTFSADSNQIAFKDMRVDPDNRYLSIADTNGTNFRQIEPLGTQDDNVHISWAPNNQYIAMYSVSSDGQHADIYPIGFNSENFTKFNVEGRDFRYAYSPSANTMLYSVYNANSNYNPSLFAANSNPALLGTGRTSLDLQTWADKCIYASEATAYCAVPRQLETGSGLRPDFADNTPDDIYKINVLTGAKELAAQPIFPTTIQQLLISRDGKYLYFLEKGTGQIKKINL